MGFSDIFKGKQYKSELEALQQKYDELSAKSGHSRNELITMALQYAIDNLHFVEE